MKRKVVSGIMLILLLIGMLTWTLRIQSVRSESTISTSYNYATVQESGLEWLNSTADIFAFYYSWYGTPDVSGYWFHWDEGDHNPDNFLDDRRDIGAKHYPMLGVYDSNNASLIEKHIEIAKMANIDGFVISWWGIGSFEDNVLPRIEAISEQNDFKFTIYYETTSSVSDTVNDITYILNNYADSSSWYTIDGRPVIYIYGRALHQLYPKMWKIDGNPAYWSLTEDIREPPRHGIFKIHPYRDSAGYVESNPIFLPPNETYWLELAISDFRDDCSPHSDVGFSIKIKNATEEWKTLDDLFVNFNDGWLDLSYDISSYGGQTVSVRVESYAGGVMEWCSEWAAVDYLYIINSKGEIINEGPYFDNEWKTVVETLTESGFNPYFIVDFGGYEWQVKYFAEYFLDFTDGIHMYAPVGLSMSDVSEVYNEASNAAHSKNKVFVATVMPGYDDTAIRSPGYVVDRENGTYYRQSWLTAKASLPDGYIITSFNEWHEGTEIEPSLEYGYRYIDLTRTMSTPLVGDLNNDGKVDIEDIATTALAFGSYPNHPRWKSQADINQDGKVDIKDIAIIAMNFGKTYP